MSLQNARQFAARTFLSGPVGGAVGAMKLMSNSGVSNFITFDMGGTSTDVALIRNQMPRISFSGQVDAFLLQIPQLDIHTIGAGGGSIAWRQVDTTLEVGPRRAGALPGPACYGRGGNQATISDANVVLGRLPASRPLSGGLVLSFDAAAAAIDALLDPDTRQTREDLAEGIIRIAVAKMAGAVRAVSVHRGWDPREFVLVGFGGAGPMHVFLVAEELGVSHVMIPLYPGHLSALGQILADQRHDLVRSWGGRLSSLALDDLKAILERMREEGNATLQEDGFTAADISHSHSADMRYTGQSFTLNVQIWSLWKIGRSSRPHLLSVTSKVMATPTNEARWRSSAFVAFRLVLSRSPLSDQLSWRVRVLLVTRTRGLEDFLIASRFTTATL